jgi:hypothetical protein
LCKVDENFDTAFCPTEKKLTLTMPNQAQPSGFFALVANPVKFRLYLLKNLPAAYFSGVRVTQVNTETSSVTVPFKWFTRNPFRSTYFACLSMAAEMSTGILAMGNIYGRKPAVSMLIVSIEGQFLKKATGVTTFTCSDGLQIKDAIELAAAGGQPSTVRAYSSGRNKNGEIVAEFWCTWSFKLKKKQ